MRDDCPVTAPAFRPALAVVDEALRADIRLVTTLLGETLVRSEGAELLDLVELVRGRVKQGGLGQLSSAVDARLRDMDLPTTIKVVRAFTSYFHLANVTEQVHRGRTLLRQREEGGGWLQRAVARISAAGLPLDVVEAGVGSLAVRPVLTAHPTEAARRSILDQLRRVAELLDLPDAGIRRRRLAEAVELLWHTDELRIGRPDPLDEARNGIYYLEGLGRAALGDVLEELRAQLAGAGVALPPSARPLTFGTWIGGDRDGNPHVTPSTTLEVLKLQAAHGITLLLTLVDTLRRELSVSQRVSGASAALLARMAESLHQLPEVEPRYRRLNAEEPYRLFLTCVRTRRSSNSATRRSLSRIDRCAASVGWAVRTGRTASEPTAALTTSSGRPAALMRETARCIHPPPSSRCRSRVRPRCTCSVTFARWK